MSSWQMDKMGQWVNGDKKTEQLDLTGFSPSIVPKDLVRCLDVLFHWICFVSF